MIRLLKATFARSKLRRDMQFDPKLKDFTSTRHMKKQQQQSRASFQQQTDVIFTDILKQKKPKLDQRFYINKQQLNKKVRKVYTSAIKMENLQPASEDDLRFLQQDKSHLYDQREAVEFEEKFQKQLFRKKETNRLLEIERLKPTNYIQGKQNQQFLQYQQAKNQLKNLNIQSMMKFKNSNQQLQLLIQSGFVDDPSNIELIIKHYQQKEHSTKLISTHTHQENSDSNQLITQQNDKYSQLTEANKLGLQIHVGPQQLGNIEKIDEYLKRFQNISKEQQKNCQKQLLLLKKIKQYQKKLFLSRYDAINFRYKGRVQFSFFKENQLISYLKNHQIHPKNLFLMFQQNQAKFNKENQPIITPSVMSRIYTKSCFYQFPETDSNNKINMLNDPIFVKLEKKLFKNIDKVNDSFLAECVWAYAKNHQEEMGLLKIEMNKKIQLSIIQQLYHRALHMTEDNLGLILKSLTKMTVMSFQEVNWSPIIQIISQRLSQIEDSYVRQNIYNFLSLLPTYCYEQTLPIMSNNLNLLANYRWEFIQTVKCFLRVSAFLLRYNEFIDPQTTKYMSHILYNKSQQIIKIMPKISINDIPHLITIIQKLGVRHPLITKIINGSKKQIIDIMHSQKQQLSKMTLQSISLSFAIVDYQNALNFISDNQKDLKIVKSIETSQIMLSNLFPFRVFNYNSIHYYFYHELGRFTQSQLPFLQPNQIINTLLGFSIVGYKNQAFYDGIFVEVIKRIPEIGPQNQIICYINIVKCYYFQKRINDTIFSDISTKIQQLLGYLQQRLAPENYIALFLCVFSLKGKNVSNKFKLIYEQIMQYYIVPLLQHLDKQHLLSLFYTQSMYEYPNSKRLHLLEKLIKQSGQTLQIEQQFLLLISQNYLLDAPSSNNNLQHVQEKFYKKAKTTLIKNQEHIGTRLSYNAVYERVKQKLLNNYPNSIIKQKPMLLIVEEEKQVYFIATYDHLMVKFTDEGKTFMSLFGLWKAYQIYYSREGYNFNLICSFLE